MCFAVFKVASGRSELPIHVPTAVRYNLRKIYVFPPSRGGIESVLGESQSGKSESVVGRRPARRLVVGWV